MRRALLAIALCAGLPLLAESSMNKTALQMAAQAFKVNTAMCVIDVSTATFFLGQSGIAINHGVNNCGKSIQAYKNDDPVQAEKDKAACAATVTFVVAGFSYAASFLSAAASECANTLNMDAYCSADISGFLGSLSLLAQAGSSLRDSCGVQESQTIGGVTIGPWNQLLKGIQAGNDEAIELRNQNVAECVFDVGQATFFLARAGMAVNAAVSDCHTDTLRATGRKGQARCSVDINGLIGSFSFVASMVSFAVAKCPILTNVNAICAAEVANLIAGLAGVAATGSSLKATCGHQAIPGESEPGVLPVRRLAQPAPEVDAPVNLV